MVAATSVVTVVLAISCFANNVVATKPNIVFIMADDLGNADVSYKGYAEFTTTHIDALATNGVRLENYYVAPSCGPTRSQFLSGRYSIHLGLQESNLPACTKESLPLGTTIADAMKTEGYSTHAIGKWHAGYHTAAHIPTSRGFDTFRGFLLSHGEHYTHTRNYQNVAYLDYRNNADKYEADIGVYSTTAFTSRAKELIGSHDATTPMFMYLSYQAPHSPLEAPESYINAHSSIPIEDRRNYTAMVKAIDDGVGEVVQALKDKGIYDNTVIIFSSDNGGATSQGASNYPLRGQKGSYFDGGVRAVGVVSSPLIAADKRGRQMNDLMHITDWLPTMVGIASGSVAGLTLDGVNQWNTISLDSGASRTEVLLNIERDQAGGQAKPFKTAISAALVSDGWKILTGRQSSDHVFPNPSSDYTQWDLERNTIREISRDVKLFNMTADPSESNNLADSETDKLDELLAKLRTFQLGMEPSQVETGANYDPECSPASTGNMWGPWL